MERKEKLVIHGNEFYVIDLDCLEKKRLEEERKKKEIEKTRNGRKKS